MLFRIRQLLHVHWFRPVWSTYAYAYEECRCTKRRARPLLRDGAAPVAMWWLDGLTAPRTAVSPAESRTGVSDVR